MKFDLVGIGNPVYDSIVTPVIKTEGRVLSGCSTNACLAARRLGLKKVGLIGCIGADFAERFRSEIERYGVAANLNATSSETGGFHLIYDKGGNRTLDVLGVASKITPENIPDAFLESKFFLIGPVLGEVDLQLIEFIRSSSNSPIFLDPQGLVRLVGPDRRVIHSTDREMFRKISQLVDYVKPNEQESATITGLTAPLEALRELSQFGPGVQIVTLAERGSLLLDRGKVYRIPAFETRTIDPTGAGDVYAGAFITEYEHTGDTLQASLFASAAASLKVEQVGPDFKMPNEVVEKRRNQIRGRLAADTLP